MNLQSMMQAYLGSSRSAFLPLAETNDAFGVSAAIEQLAPM